jgi:lysozyme family protein
MSNFDAAFKFVIGAEGAWSGDPNDRGNWTGGKVLAGTLRGTKYGISAAAYPDLDIASLALSDAETIYRNDYWEKIHGDTLPDRIAMFAFDCAVNQGVSAAIRLLQTTYGVTVDGIIGSRTVTAIQNTNLDLETDFLARRAVLYASGAAFANYGLGWMRRLFRLANYPVN